ncbi:MAG TPA: cytidylate kinase family protein [Alphaproteobacteria bacterium]
MNLGRTSSKAARDTGDEKPLIISISGDLGSGKSLLANALVERWVADRYSTGMVQRRIADRMGITTLELNKRAETDKSIDEQIDSVFRNLAKTPKNLIVDSRMAFHFLPMSFKIKLEVHPGIAAARIQGDTSRVGEGNYNTIDEIEAAILARKASERERFKKYYDADIEDHAGYDLVINTTDCPPEAVAVIANEAIDLWRKGHHTEKLWVSPRFLYVDASNQDGLNQAQIEKYKISWPGTADWAHDSVQVAKAGFSLVVQKGAEWVSAGLKANKPLLPVTLTSSNITAPDTAANEAWQKSHNFKYLVNSK